MFWYGPLSSLMWHLNVLLMSCPSPSGCDPPQLSLPADSGVWAGRSAAVSSHVGPSAVEGGLLCPAEVQPLHLSPKRRSSRGHHQPEPSAGAQSVLVLVYKYTMSGWLWWRLNCLCLCWRYHLWDREPWEERHPGFSRKRKVRRRVSLLLSVHLL